MLATVFSQVMILMIMIAVGFAAAKAKIMTAEGARCCTDIALIIATPCVIIKSLIREYSNEIMKSLAFAIFITLLVQVLMIFLSRQRIKHGNGYCVSAQFSQTADLCPCRCSR